MSYIVTENLGEEMPYWLVHEETGVVVAKCFGVTLADRVLDMLNEEFVKDTPEGK